jgi:6-phosphogluconolactonase
MKLPALLSTLAMSTTLSAASQLIFIGTYTPKNGASRGVYAARLDPETGTLSEPVLAAETPNPTFLVRHPVLPVVYAAGEGPGLDRPVSSGATAFRLDATSGQLTLLNSRGADTAGTTHLGVDTSGRMLITVSYSGGQIAAFPLAADGRIGARSAHILPTGQLGPNQARQDKPHPHSVTLSPDNRFAYVCDLGLDRILCYRLDPEKAALTAAGETATKPGAGPRHSKFSADGRFFYVINELDGTIVAYAVVPATGALTPVQTVSTLPAGFAGENTCAEIRLSPDGRFVYGSNRGHDSLAVFARDAARGTLTPVETVPSGGGHPRNFNLTPDGHWLVCANRDSNNLVLFKVDPATGRLQTTGHTVSVPTPVCVLFPGE